MTRDILFVPVSFFLSKKNKKNTLYFNVFNRLADMPQNIGSNPIIVVILLPNLGLLFVLNAFISIEVITLSNTQIMRINNFKHQIEWATYEVFRELGRGLNRAIYLQALKNALMTKGLSVTAAKTFNITCENEIVGAYVADLCISEVVVIQVMAAETVKESEENTLTNQLTLVRLELGYLINFGNTPEIKTKFRRDRPIVI